MNKLFEKFREFFTNKKEIFKSILNVLITLGIIMLAYKIPVVGTVIAAVLIFIVAIQVIMFLISTVFIAHFFHVLDSEETNF